MEKQNWVEIVPDKLRKEISSRNLKITKVERELGAGSAISNALSRGRISKPLMLLLEKVYGITEDAIKPQEEKKGTVPVAEIDEPQKKLMVAALTEVMRSVEFRVLLANTVGNAVNTAIKKERENCNTGEKNM